MFLSIQYLSLEKFKLLKPSTDTVVVSILDESEWPKRPRLANWRSALALKFEDTYEEVKCASAHWPDEPTAEEHARYCQGAGERIPTLTDAQLIRDFLEWHGTSLEQLHLIVHCYAGVSRSSAVAQWAAGRFFVPLEREPGYPNKRVLRLLGKTRKA